MVINTETEVKQVVGKRRNKKRYFYPLPGGVYGGVYGLYTLRSSRDGCRGKLNKV